jgi:cell division septal protein FtsQ
MAAGLLGALLIPAAVFVVADEAFESRFFLVREVEVTGLKQVDRLAVERAAGLEHPRSVLTLRAEEMQASIETLPWVKSAAVDVSLHGRVAIAVHEAELAGVVSAGELYLMDSGGDPIRRWTPADGLAGPLFVGFDKQSEGATRIDRAAWLRARKVLLAFEGSELGKRFKVAEVQAATGNSFRLLLSTGTEVRLRDDRLPERLSRLTEAFAQLDARQETPDYLMLDGDSLQQVVFRARQVASLETPITDKN